MFMKRLPQMALALFILMALAVPAQAESSALDFDMSAWRYNEEDDVYWQVGAAYCQAPAAAAYETLGIFVPGAYLSATDNGDGTYTCVLNEAGQVAGYSADSAPIVMPVNTAGYSAQAALTDYAQGVKSYTSAGFIYVYAGCRGRNNGYDENGDLAYAGGAPWGVTDLKAAVRYLRYNAGVLPGDTQRIFTFGHSGGGAQSALMGATGDSELYLPYLESIGAALTGKDGSALSDAICGAMCWCPITSLDYANEAYEWNMGQYFADGARAQGTWTRLLSGDLARAYAAYVNTLELISPEGVPLTLSESDDGIYAAGSYYDYLLGQVELSLNHFLSDTQFPYTATGKGQMADGGFPGGAQRGQRQGRSLPAGGTPPDGGHDGAGQAQSVTYETAQDYIDALNGDDPWIDYDPGTHTATVSSIRAFVLNQKSAAKDVGAFDDLNRAQAENLLFGDQQSDALHFDYTIAALLEQNQQMYAACADWDAAYVEAYNGDLESTDQLGTPTAVRQNMYNPMYYLLRGSEGYGQSTPAAYWRIRSGITQSDTALTVETNLALALSSCAGVEDVDFAMVWGQGHTTAERTGSSAENFIDWVNQCCA